MKKVLLLLFAGLMLAGCGISRRVTVMNAYPAYPGTPSIYYPGQNMPEGMVKIGSVNVGDKGMNMQPRKCDYQVCMDAIMEEAKKMGGDVVVLVTVKEPGILQICYQIAADIYVSAERQANVK